MAIFIFSVLFTVLFGSFRTLSSSSDALGRGSAQFEMGRSCISRISSDIESAYVSIPPFFKQPDLRETDDPYRWEGTSENVDGETGQAKVVALDRDIVSLQVFAGGKGLSTDAVVRFLGHPPNVTYSNNILGRIFRGGDRRPDGAEPR